MARTHVFLLSLILTVSSACRADVVASYASYYDNKQYTFEVTRSALDGSPAWDEGSANPPLAARDAIHKARARLSSLVTTAKKWELAEISLRVVNLQPRNRWIYVVRFTPPEPVAKGAPADMRIIILMNGTSIDPIVRSI